MKEKITDNDCCQPLRDGFGTIMLLEPETRLKMVDDATGADMNFNGRKPSRDRRGISEPGNGAYILLCVLICMLLGYLLFTR